MRRLRRRSVGMDLDMTDDVRDHVSAILNAAMWQPGRDITDALRDAMNALADDETADHAAARRAIAAELPAMFNGYGAGHVAVWIGAAVEQGVPAQESIEATYQAFRKWASQIAGNDDGTAVFGC